MNTDSLYKEYFQRKTAGYAIIRKFHSQYADLLVKASLVSIDDVVHEIFLSISKTDFSEVRNVEHYIMRAIKLHCWSLLDKAIRRKAISVKNEAVGEKKEESHEQDQIAANQNDQLSVLEGNDLLLQINLFKTRLDPVEATLLNSLIDESERAEIADSLGMNLNTLDTKIRRLRIKLAEYLKRHGYVHKGMERFS